MRSRKTICLKIKEWIGNIAFEIGIAKEVNAFYENDKIDRVEIIWGRVKCS